MNESQLINEVIVPALIENGWNNHDIFHFKLNHKVQILGKTIIADIVLFAVYNPIGVIEVKTSGADLSIAIQQAKRYAEAMDLKLVYATDGEKYVQYNSESDTVDAIEGIPSAQFLQENHNFQFYK
jgi:type I restriction enzyme, R subunit